MEDNYLQIRKAEQFHDYSSKKNPRSIRNRIFAGAGLQPAPSRFKADLKTLRTGLQTPKAARIFAGASLQPAPSRFKADLKTLRTGLQTPKAAC